MKTDNEIKKKFDANIKALNKDLIAVSEGELSNDELIKIQFKAIRALIDDCEKLVLNK